MVSNLVKDSFELWLNEHIDYAKRLAAVVVNSAYARSKAEVKVDRKRGNNNIGGCWKAIQIVQIKTLKIQSFTL